ncbi:TPA: hypothetical protein ACGO8I_000961 [Streptococcus suis]
MKIKRSSSKKQLHKWTKLGLGLAAVTVLGGLVEPVGLADFGLTKVYAETYVNTSDQLIGVVIWHFAENTDGSSFRLNGDGGYMEFQPGQEIISSAPNYDGYTLSHTTYAPPVWDGGDGILSYVYKQNKIAEQPEEPAGDTNSTDKPSVPQPASGQPTVEDRYDVVALKYRDENGEDLGEDLMMVYPTSSQRITPPTFEGYEFKEASVGENYLMYSKPISLPYEHRFAQVLTEQDLNNHSNFLGGRIKEAQDSLRDGSAYTYILNYRKTSPSQQAPQPITFPVRYVSVDYAADKGVVITGVLYETTATVEPGGTVIIENKTFDGYSLDTMEGPWKTEHSYEDVVAAGWSDGIDLRYSANTPTIDHTTDTANGSVDVAFQEASIRLYNLLMTASRLNPDDYTAESYNKGYESLISPGFTESIVTVLNHYKEVVNGNVKLEDSWDNGASPKAWLTEVYNSDSSVLEQALAGLVAVQQETPSDSSSAGTDEGTTGKTSQTPTDKPAEIPVETSVVTKPAETPTEQPVETPVEQPTEQPVDKPGERPTTKPTDQSVPGKEDTKHEIREQAAPASQSKQSTDKPAPASQSQAKTLPGTGEVSSVLHLMGMGLLGLAGLVVKRRSGKSS